ncbi:MAG: tRNA lysidine(34) synthetase TilS [Candidatus Latescibacterota bacterium]
MNEFEQKVVNYCKRHRLLATGDRVLVALSGGGDSVALLACLLRIRDIFNITVEAGHLNHSLRGTESDTDELFSKELCDHLKVHLTVSRLSEGELKIKDESLESAARKARQNFLETVARERSMTKIATGHNLDDLSETILQRIIRGTGPSGLAGILPKRDNFWIRPLLDQSRSDIRVYLEENGIGYREDSSNYDTIFFRNRIRHELLPLLKDRFSPNITSSLTRLAELSRLQEEYLHDKMLESFKHCCFFKSSGKILLDKHKLMSYHKVLRQRIVRHCLELLEGSGRDTDKEEIERILDCISFEQSGMIDVSKEVRCGTGKNSAAFIKIFQQYKPFPLSVPGETWIPDDGCITVREVSNKKTVDGRNGILLSPSVVMKYGPITIGPATKGEYMVPFGMLKPVKVFDIFSAASIPQVLRDSIPVVRAGAVSVWIPGFKSSECLRINGSCKKVLLMNYHDGPQWE